MDMHAGATLLAEMREGHLVLAFQPITRVDQHGDDACLYSEALLRRVDGPLEEMAVRSCADAIGALEYVGQIASLDFSVLWTVIRLLALRPEQRLGCNVSAMSLREQAHWGPLLSHLTRHGDLARRLTLEITETSAIPQGDAELALLTALRECGVRIAIDDLGAGFTTFEFLARCRPDVVKIDRSVLLRACTPGAPAQLLGNLVRVCADYSACIVVEGVETKLDLDVVAGSGAHCYQGFFEAPPTVEPAWLSELAVVRATAAVTVSCQQQRMPACDGAAA